MLTDRQTVYVLARDEHLCQHPDCQNPADAIRLRLTLPELHALRRDPDSPDNWCAACPQHL